MVDIPQFFADSVKDNKTRSTISMNGLLESSELSILHKGKMSVDEKWHEFHWFKNHSIVHSMHWVVKVSPTLPVRSTDHHCIAVTECDNFLDSFALELLACF